MDKKLPKIFFTSIAWFLFLSIYTKTFSQTPAITYPKITGFVGILHPIITLSSAGNHTNFQNDYVVGLPTGINIWKTAKIGFSMEIVPYIKTENGTSKMNNLLFHPGILIKLAEGLTFAGRAAFETSGRYGLTPVLNKVVIRSKNCNYYIALTLPARFGNDQPNSVGTGFQFGITF